MADKPESFYEQPKGVQDFLGALPTAWDNTRFIAGYPGEFVVLARQKGKRWYIAGINGTDSEKKIPLSIKGIVKSIKKATLYLDDSKSENGWRIIRKPFSRLPRFITCQSRGGFVIAVGNQE